MARRHTFVSGGGRVVVTLHLTLIRQCIHVNIKMDSGNLGNVVSAVPRLNFFTFRSPLSSPSNNTWAVTRQNPNTSEESKQHSREVLDDMGSETMSPKTNESADVSTAGKNIGNVSGMSPVRSGARVDG